MDELLKELTEIIKSIKDVSKEQLPELGKDILKDAQIKAYTGIVYGGILAISGKLLIALGLIGYFYIEFQFITFIVDFIGLLIMGGGIETIINCTKDLYRIKHAPKAVLLEFLRGKNE